MISNVINVLIVEDSLVTRQYLKHILESDGSIRVIAMAEDGKEAIRLVGEHMPDVVTMDINMPGMDGFDATRQIMETYPLPIVIVSASYNRKDVEKSFRAIEAGAVSLVEKPFGKGHPDHEIMAKNLIQTVKLMSEVKVIKRWPKKLYPLKGAKVLTSFSHESVNHKIKLVTIGVSTGGPPVLKGILKGLKKGFPTPILIVQHIAGGFLKGLVEWLNETTVHPIHIAADGERILPGHVYFAPDEFQMGIDTGRRITLSKAPPENGIRPSVSYLFRSASNAFGRNMIGVILTGMGRDGANELKLMKDLGAITIAQDKDSSAIFGMPGEAIKLKAASYVLPANCISNALESIFHDNTIRGTEDE
jgi:two-component system chemotaxis response regulator CheB